MAKEFFAQASEQALGYLYQVRYALLLLIKAGTEDTSAQIAIESLDDIVFSKEGSPRELIQTKHHLNQKASLSDASSDLWKTLRVWSENFLQNKLDTKNVILTLITTAQAPKDSVASKLRPHISGTRNIDEALKMLITTAQSSDNKANKAAYKAFLGLSHDQQKWLLTQVHILDCAPNILDIETKIANHLSLSTRPNFVAPVCERLEGWWFTTVVKHLSSRTPNLLTYRDLQILLNSIQEQFYEDNLPNDYPDPISVTEKEAEEDQRMFTHQLRLIGVRRGRIQKALGDYYRASAQRSRWIRDAIILHQELERYDMRLCDEWERHYEIMQEDFTDNPTEEEMQKGGRELFNNLQDAALYIRSRCTEEHIARGSYHILSDQLRVGWHVEFRIRLHQLQP